MIRTFNLGKKVHSTQILAKELNWVTSPWICNQTSEIMQKAISFEVGVQKTVTETAGISVNLSSALSIGFEKSISWAQSITKVDTVTISIKPYHNGAIKYQTGWCQIEVIVRETFKSKETNGHCGFISEQIFHKDHRSVVYVKVHMGDAIGVEEPAAKYHIQAYLAGLANEKKQVGQHKQVKAEKQNKKACLKSKGFGWRLSASSQSSVRLSSKQTSSEDWIWQWISPNKFHWKSKKYGTYLRARPDGHVDLTKKPDKWQIWTKIESGSSIYWKSHHGTYLSACSNKTVFFFEHKQDNQKWVH